MVVLYIEACIEFQRKQKALDTILNWIDNSVPVGQRGLIFGSVGSRDTYPRSQIISGRFMSTHQNGLVNCIGTLLDIKIKQGNMAGLHVMLNE